MEPVVHLRGAVALLGRFPALAGANLDVRARRDRPGPRAQRRRQDHAPAGLRRACCRWSPARPSCWATTCGRDRRAVRAEVGLLGHATGLYDDLTVAENVRFWAPRRRARPTPRSPPPWTALGLDGRAGRRAVGRLSAGQRRRTSLAVLVARRPELWLLDEPHAGLDAAGRDVLDALVGEAAAAGATVLLASHELDRAGALADAGSSPWPAAIVPRRPTLARGAVPMLAVTPALVAGKDLRIEPRSRVAHQPGHARSPCCVLLAVRLRPRPRPQHPRHAPRPGCSGWPSCSRAARRVQRSFAVEEADGTRDALRLSGLDPAGIFLGKAAAWPLQLLVLEVLLGVGVRRALRRPTLRAGVAPARRDRLRDHGRAGRHRYALRCPRRRVCGCARPCSRSS